MTDSENQLFISYAQIDNQPLSKGEQGWVTQFHASLSDFLSKRMGKYAKIWRDEKLLGNEEFSEIVDQFNKSAVFISILSPRYSESDWCTREIREFCEAARKRGDLLIDNKSRVFKVLKTPLDNMEFLPRELTDMLGYQFFVEEDGAPLELDPAFGKKYGQLRLKKLNQLAWDITQFFKILDANGNDNKTARKRVGNDLKTEKKPAIYLAECSFDKKQVHETIKGELKRLGYLVLPEQQLPQDESEYIVAVESLLERCALSIHLVGEHYGAVPNGPSLKSVSELQNELAVTRSKSGGLTRLIWLPDDTSSEQEQQKAFIKALHQDAQAQFGADLITGDIEELKAAVHSTLKKLEQEKPRSPGPTVDGTRMVYLICDEKDRKATIPIRKLCKHEGLEVQLPVFEGNASEIRKVKKQLFTSCDAILLYYGAGDEAWKRAIDNELKRMAVYRTDRVVPMHYTYLAEPTTPDKEEMIEMEIPKLINCLGGFKAEAMSECIHAMKSDGKSS